MRRALVEPPAISRGVLIVATLLCLAASPQVADGRPSSQTGATAATAKRAALPASVSKAEAASDEMLIQRAIDLFLAKSSGAATLDDLVAAGWLASVVSDAHLDAYIQNAYSAVKHESDPATLNFLRWVPERFGTSVPSDPLCGEAAPEGDLNCLILSSLWCDVVESPADLLKQLQVTLSRAKKGADREKAGLLVLALGELKARRCLNERHVEALLAETVRFLGWRMEDPEGMSLQGLAFLLHAGVRASVRPEWIASIRTGLTAGIESGCEGCGVMTRELLMGAYALAQWNESVTPP